MTFSICQRLNPVIFLLILEIFHSTTSPHLLKQHLNTFLKIKISGLVSSWMKNFRRSWKPMHNDLTRSSKICCRMHSNLPRREKSDLIFTMPNITGARLIQIWRRPNELLLLRSGTQVLVFQKTSRISSLKRSSKRKVLPAVSMAALV